MVSTNAVPLVVLPLPLPFPWLLPSYNVLFPKSVKGLIPLTRVSIESTNLYMSLIYVT